MTGTFFEDVTHITSPTGSERIPLTVDPTGTPSDGYMTPDDIKSYSVPVASDVAITDSGTYYAGSDVEAALQEAGAKFSLLRYTVHANCLAFSPADGTTYYFGAPFSNSPSPTAAVHRVYIDYSGTITKIRLSMVNGTNGTSETSTVSLRLNNTSDTTISAVVDNSGAFYALASVSIAVTAGDYVQIKWVSPTWATNPTNVTINAVIYIAE